MKKFLLATVGLVALHMAAPASAADLAARPYKAPPPVVAVYDWSGFYIGANGGGGWSHKCWDVNNFRTPIAPFAEGCHDATGGVVGGQIGYRWQSAGWVFGLEAQGDWADLKASNTSLFIPAWTNNSKIEAFGLFTGQVGYAWNNVLWYVKGGAAVTSDKYRWHRDRHRRGCSMRRVKHAGVGPSERASNSGLHRIGRLRSSTITCSWVTETSPSRRQACWLVFRPAAYSAPTRSVRMSIWSLRASTTASVARSSRDTDLTFLSPANFKPRHRPGLFAFALDHCGFGSRNGLSATLHIRVSSPRHLPEVCDIARHIGKKGRALKIQNQGKKQ